MIMPTKDKMSGSGKKTLTEQQARLHYEACQFVRIHGRQPSFSELGAIMNVSRNAIFSLMKKLRGIGYIQDLPRSNKWKIVKWFESSDGYDVPVIGEIDNGLVVLYHDENVGKVWLPLPEETFPDNTRDNLFILRLKNCSNPELITNTAVGGGLLFQRHRICGPSRIVLAVYNGRIGLFKYSSSQTQIILQKGESEQSTLPLFNHDHMEILGVLLWTLEESRMRLS